MAVTAPALQRTANIIRDQDEVWVVFHAVPALSDAAWTSTTFAFVLA